MARKPSVADVPKNAWRVKYLSGLVRVETAEVKIAEYTTAKGTAGYKVVADGTPNSFDADFWRVTNLITNKSKTYFGESAWMDARREASDLDFGAWGI
jgi:hypothetical protein